MKLLNRIKMQRGGFYYDNPYKQIPTRLLSTALSYPVGIQMGNALGYNQKSTKKLAGINMFNSALTGAGNTIQDFRRNKELRDYQKRMEESSYFKVPYDNFRYNEYSESSTSGDYFQNGGLQRNGTFLNSGRYTPEKQNPFPNISHYWDKFNPGNSKSKKTFGIADLMGKSLADQRTSKTYQGGGLFEQLAGRVPESLNGLYEYDEPVMVPSNRITMKGINEEVLAIPDNDPITLMKPEKEYSFSNSKKVLEIPSSILEDNVRYGGAGWKSLSADKLYEKKHGGISDPPTTNEFSTFISESLPIPLVTAKKENTYLPTIDTKKFIKTTCNTKNCSEWSTTALSNILATDRDKVSNEVAESAWFKREKVLSNGGEDVWNLNKGVKLNNAELQVGDFVSLSRPGRASAEQKDPKVRNGLQKEIYNNGKTHVAHSGIIIGKNKQGIPIVEHNINGKLKREPINDVRIYKPVSVFRSIHTKNTDFKAYKNKIVNLNENFEENKVLLPNKKLQKVFDENKKKIQHGLSLSNNFTEKMYENLIGISAQESNLDNELSLENLRDLGSYFKQGVKKHLPEKINSLLKKADNAFNIERDGVPKWQAEINAVTPSMKNNKFDEEIYLKELSKIPLLNKDTKDTSKSKGMFKQKHSSELAERTFDIDSRLPFLTKKDQLLQASSLYVSNYKKAKKKYPTLSEEELHKITTLAHNAPGKAFSQDYVNFYILGNNPDPQRFRSHYIDQVENYKKNLTGSASFQLGGKVLDSTPQSFYENTNTDNFFMSRDNTDTVSLEDTYGDLNITLDPTEPLGPEEYDLSQFIPSFQTSTLDYDYSNVSKRIEDKGNTIKKGLMERGFTDEQSAAILGNLYAESALDEQAVANSTKAFGLMQWLGNRKEQLFNRYGSNPTLSNQLDYIKWELTGGNPYETSQFNKAMQGETLNDKTMNFAKMVERPSAKEIEESTNRRLKYANLFS